MAKVSNALRTIDFARRRRGLDPTEVSAFLQGIAEEVAVLEEVAADAEAVLNEIGSHRAALESDIGEKDRLAAAERTSAYARAADTLRDAHHQAQAIVGAADLRASSIVPRPAPTGGHTGLRRRASDAADAARLTSAALEAEAICAAARSEADKILAAADAQIALLSGSAQAEADQVIAAAGTEAAAASSLERAAANRSSDKVRRDAVILSAASRAEADRLLADATAEAAVVSTAAREASDRILEHARHEAAEHAATVSRAALAEADRILAAATAQAALLSSSIPAADGTVSAPGGGTPPAGPSRRPADDDHLADHLEDVGGWDGPGFDDLVDVRERLTDGIESLYATDHSRGHWWTRLRP